MNNILEQPTPELRKARVSSWLPIRLGKQEQAEPCHVLEAIKGKTSRQRKREEVSSSYIRKYCPKGLGLSLYLTVSDVILCGSFDVISLDTASADQPVVILGLLFSHNGRG